MSSKPNCSRDYDDHNDHEEKYNKDYYDEYGKYEEKYDDYLVKKYNKHEEKTKIRVKKIDNKQVKTLKKFITKRIFYSHTN